MIRTALVSAGMVVPPVLPLWAAQGAPAASGALRSAAALAIVVALMFALAWAVRRFGPVTRTGKNLGLSVLGQVHLGPKTALALVRVGKSVLLVGVTSSSVNLIKDLDADRFEEGLTAAGGGEGGAGLP